MGIAFQETGLLLGTLDCFCPCTPIIVFHLAGSSSQFCWYESSYSGLQGSCDLGKMEQSLSGSLSEGLEVSGQTGFT